MHAYDGAMDARMAAGATILRRPVIRSARDNRGTPTLGLGLIVLRVVVDVQASTASIQVDAVTPVRTSPSAHLLLAFCFRSPSTWIRGGMSARACTVLMSTRCRLPASRAAHIASFFAPAPSSSTTMAAPAPTWPPTTGAPELPAIAHTPPAGWSIAIAGHVHTDLPGALESGACISGFDGLGHRIFNKTATLMCGVLTHRDAVFASSLSVYRWSAPPPHQLRQVVRIQHTLPWRLDDAIDATFSLLDSWMAHHRPQQAAAPRGDSSSYSTGIPISWLRSPLPPSTAVRRLVALP